MSKTVMGMKTSGKPASGTTMPLPKNRMMDLLYYMKLTRELETRIERKLYRQGKIVGGVYVGRGQEAIAVASAIQLEKEDWICPSHRDMGAFIIRGLPLKTILAQYMARATGPTRGKDGNMHMGSLEHHLVAFVSMLGCNVTIATGIGLAMKKKKMKNVVLCFFGEGATSTGNWHEGLNFASVLQAPVIFICNNNSYAYSTPNSKQFAIKDVATRGASYGIPSDVVDGNNVLEIYESAKIAIDRARNGGGPTLIECKTFRMTGHSAHDDAGYVPANEFEEWFKRDPIVRYQNHLLSNRLINEKYIAELDKKIKEELDEAVQLAEKEPFPEPTECLKNVYDNGINDLIVGKIPFWRKESLDNTNLDKPREWGEYSTPSP